MTLSRSLSTIRDAAQETARLAETHQDSPIMLQALADMSETQHRIVCLGLRYAHDDDRLADELMRIG